MKQYAVDGYTVTERPHSKLNSVHVTITSQSGNIYVDRCSRDSVDALVRMYIKGEL